MANARHHSASTKNEWYDTIAMLIDNNVEEFYEKFYPGSSVKRIGSQYTLEPCPACGHKNCCRIGPNMVNCLSANCGWSGTHINAWCEYAKNAEGFNYGQSIRALADYFDLPFPEEMSAEEAVKQEHIRRQQDILSHAEKFYHTKMLNCAITYPFKENLITPLDYLLNVRKRSLSTIKSFKIGFSINFLELRAELIAAGFSEEEITESNIRIPEGLFCFFYHHPTTRDIVRINTKNPFESRKRFYNESKEEILGDVIVGWSSSGIKSFYYAPKFSFKHPIVMVEGEHDLFSVHEHGCENVLCLGGMVSAQTYEVLNQCESVIYTAFDNDAAGENYLNIVNKMFPEKQLKRLVFPAEYKDIDEYYCYDPNSKSIPDLMEAAVDVECDATQNYKIFHYNNVWNIQDRSKRIEFIIKERTDRGILLGQANKYNKDGKLEKRQEQIALSKCPTKDFQPFAYTLSDAIEHYFNSNLDSKSLEELVMSYRYSSRKNEIIHLLATKISESNNVEFIVGKIKGMMKDIPDHDKTIDMILVEYTNVINAEFVEERNYIPKIKISQYYNIPNGDAYFYFISEVKDVSETRYVPYLLKNDGTKIRLDLLKKKDPQCLLLIENKYELPCEVPTAIFDIEHCSLQSSWVNKWLNKKIDEDELKPNVIIKKIESWIRKFYFSNNPDIYKVLALWTFGTYFYMLFGKYPYLYLNGQKGSGKTQLGRALSMISFNARAIIDTSEAALFRMASLEGGTIMLDEQETISSRTKGAESFGPILKGGYTSGMAVARHNNEKQVTETFDVYCPKIICNIFGLDDIIADRCLEINSYQIKISKNTQLEDLFIYENDPTFAKEISSKCCLCALARFQELNKIYRDDNNVFESDNARLSQIMTPLLALAKWVDMDEVTSKRIAFGLPDSSVSGEYETAFMNYYNSNIVKNKKEIESGTPEGIIKNIVINIAKELSLNLPVSEREYTRPELHKYDEPIKYFKEEEAFELNTLHFKTFIEESDPGVRTYPRIIIRWLKTCFDFAEEDVSRRMVTITNEELIKELNGSKKAKMNFYKFHIKDILKSEFLNLKESSEAPKVTDLPF